MDKEVQAVKDANMRQVEVTMTMKTQFDQEMGATVEQNEETKRLMQKQLHDTEAELEEEKKQHAAAVAAKQNIELNMKQQVIERGRGS